MNVWVQIPLPLLDGTDHQNLEKERKIMDKKDSNGWAKFEKRAKTGYLEKYKDRIAVIVAKGKPSVLYLPKAVLEAMGNPEYVEILTRGSNAAIMGGKKEDEGFKVQNHQTYCSYIACKSFLVQFGLKAGAYEAHIETGKVVFDMEQKPAVFK